ncbi:hypothetical protein CesoFtcFv8_003936 [Champsocephalus esox]|uniref:Uncharacterized protein n=1 Tax=Champsocephalus esox TaxID=159716 RepID=A0AAN8CTN9_9TELE|nr:hypothetical protein CesoFtcFv8_003936 [Champsocephalus esox]
MSCCGLDGCCAPGPFGPFLTQKTKLGSVCHLSLHLSILLSGRSAFTQLRSDPKACLISLKIPTTVGWILFYPWFNQSERE